MNALGQVVERDFVVGAGAGPVVTAPTVVGGVAEVDRVNSLGQVSDVIVNGDGELEATTVDAAFVAFRHHWNSQLRSTIAYSMFDADLEDDTEQSSSSTRINLMYSPEKSVTYGVEYSMATIEKTDESEGDLDRLQFTAKYSF